MLRIAAPLLGFALALASAPANAQAGATPAPLDKDVSTASEPSGGSAQGPTADDICRALEQSAAENALPVEFFARVIWQESRFGAARRARGQALLGPRVTRVAGFPAIFATGGVDILMFDTRLA